MHADRQTDKLSIDLVLGSSDSPAALLVRGRKTARGGSKDKTACSHSPAVGHGTHTHTRTQQGVGVYLRRPASLVPAQHRQMDEP